MSGYGPTDWKGCLVFILIIPVALVCKAWDKLKKLFRIKGKS